MPKFSSILSGHKVEGLVQQCCLHLLALNPTVLYEQMRMAHYASFTGLRECNVGQVVVLPLFFHRLSSIRAYVAEAFFL